MNFQEDFKFELSIIICAYNEESHLLKCLQSLKNQNYDKSKFEIIIMDNESKDRTPQIGKEFTKLNKASLNIQYHRIMHVGLSTSRNTGISLAQGKIISFVDGDAVVDEDCVEHILTAFKSNEETAIVCGRVKNLENDSLFSKFIFYSHYESGIKARKNHVLGALVGANMAFSRRVFEVTGGFFDSFTLYGDESSVAMKYVSSNPNAVISYAEKAIVFNEHPKSLIVWLKQRFFQGRMLLLIYTHVSKSSPLKTALKAGVKFIGLCCLGIVLLHPLVNFHAGVTFLAVVFLAATIFPRSNYLFNAYREVSSSFSPWAGFAGVATCIVGNIFGDAGFVREALMALTGRKVALGNSVSNIIESR